MSNISYTPIGPVAKRVSRPINVPKKKPKRGGGIPLSAFEKAALALSPVAMYTFQEKNFNGDIKDKSGNGYDLANTGAKNAVKGSAIRAGHTGALVLPKLETAAAAENYVQYTNNSLGLLFDSEVSTTILWGMKILSTLATPNAMRVFGVHSNEATIGSTNDLFSATVASTTGAVDVRERHTTGGGNRLDTVANTDGVIRAFACRYDSTLDNKLFRISKNDASAALASINTTDYTRADYNKSFRVGDGRAAEHGFEIAIDFIAVWPSTAITDAQINTLLVAYEDEMA